METVIILAEELVTDQKPVTVTHVELILIWTTGAIAHVMMDMWDLTVQAIILMLTQVQLVTIHVQEAAMVLRHMTVSAVVTMHTWMLMDTVLATKDTMETSVTTPTMFPTTTTFMPTASLHLTITISMDTSEIITTMVDM